MNTHPGGELKRQPQSLTLNQLGQIISWQTLGDQPFIVTISGGSGSGKSTLAAQLAADFPGQTVVLSTDDYFIGQTHM